MMAVRWWLPLLLGALCVALLVLIVNELAPEPPQSAGPAAAMPSASPAPASVPPFNMPPLTTFSEVIARPLFSPTRRPAVDAGQNAPSSSFTLVGVVISQGERHALLASGQPVKISRVGEGQELGGWTIEEILPGKVIVRHGDQREEVKAKDFSHAPTAAAKGAATASVVPIPVIVPDPGRQSVPHRPPHDQ